VRRILVCLEATNEYKSTTRERPASRSTDKRAHERSRSQLSRRRCPTERDTSFVAIDEWLPGAEPTPYELNLTDGYEYRTRYWRCRKCSQERNHRDEFTVPCDNPQPATALEAGGYSINDPRTRRALNEKLDVRFATVGPILRG